MKGVFLLEREVVAVSDGLAVPECPREVLKIAARCAQVALKT